MVDGPNCLGQTVCAYPAAVAGIPLKNTTGLLCTPPTDSPAKQKKAASQESVILGVTVGGGALVVLVGAVLLYNWHRRGVMPAKDTTEKTPLTYNPAFSGNEGRSRAALVLEPDETRMGEAEA